MSGMTCGDMEVCLPQVWDGKIPNMPMTLTQWESEMVRVLGKEKGREMGVAIFVDNLGIGPGNVPATQREEVGKGFGKNWQGPGQFGFGKGGKGFGKNWQGPGQNWYGTGGNGKKVLGIKVHASTASRLGTGLLSAKTYGWLRRSLR